MNRCAGARHTLKMEASIRMNESRRLGEENISTLLRQFSIPCILGLLIGAFYNIVDQIFIGNSELGYLGNAATGVSFPILCVANAFAFCIGDGAASYLSICAGRNDSQSAHKCVGSGITTTFIVGVVLGVLCLLFRVPLMRMFGASDQTIDMAVEYFAILAVFFPIYLLIAVLNSMIRADGSPTYAMFGMLIGAVVNIILDPIFIFLLKWGVAGAAWATVIGQIMSFAVCAVYFRKPKTFALTKKSFIPDWRVLSGTIGLGASTFVNQISIVVVSLTCNVMLAKYGALSVYGPDIPISVFSILTKVYTIVISTVTGIVLGGQPIFGYNYGARRFDRVRETYSIALKASVAVALVATAFFQLCPQLIIRIFGDGGALYEEFAVKAFRIYLMLTVATALVKLSSIFFQAIGKPVQAVVASLARDIVCFTPLAIFLPRMMEGNAAGSGIDGILYAAPIADVISLAVILVLTVHFFRGMEQNAPQEEAEELVIKPSRPGVIITIAREHGSMGKQIGKLVAQQLNIPYYYKEMTALAAQESGLDKEFIADLNDNAPAVLHELYLSTNVVRQAIVAQEQIIRKIADNGSCVIVGRAADYVLRDYDNVVRVFIHAPRWYRIQKIMEMYGDSYEDAAVNIKHSDDARAAYYRNISGREWGSPKLYDLCINGAIGKEKCADMICKFAETMEK